MKDWFNDFLGLSRYVREHIFNYVYYTETSSAAHIYSEGQEIISRP
jgi:hypothetical protein